MQISEYALKEKDIYTEQDVAFLKEYTHEIEIRIDSLLGKGTDKDILDICDLIASDNVEMCFSASKALLNLRVLSLVDKERIGKGKNSILSGRNLKEIENLYQEMVFRLRRIEFSKTIDVIDDIFLFLSENNLDIDFLIAVLRGTTYLYEKDRIWKRITEKSDAQ